MYFDLSVDGLINYLQANILACAFLLVVLLVYGYQLYFYLRYIRKGAKTTTNTYTGEQPGVSVIVCAHNEEDNLREYLHALLAQDYPCFEVIVVDDGSEDNSQCVLKEYARQYQNLYLTFVPYGARVISSKKLALTIGIKAARYDYILLTDADCRPESRFWIREMMSGFYADNVEVVLGFGAYFVKNGLLNRLIGYDTLFSGLQYMGMAKAGYPYMGVGRNLAYRKDTFFKNNGFHGLLNERAGDDDLFVNKVARKENTKVVCNADSLTWSPPKCTWREWLHQKRRHLSVSPHYSMRSKLRIGIEPFTRGLAYLLLIVSWVCCILGYLPWNIGIVVFGCWIIRLIIQLIIINLAVKRLKLRWVFLGMILYDVMLPLITSYLLIAQSFKKQQLYW
mgnify:FL=1